MGKQIFIRLSFLFLGFFLFLLVAPLNKSLAAGEGEGCRVSVNSAKRIDCDTNLFCDISSDQSSECQADITCSGTCKKIPTENIPENGPCTTSPTKPDGGCAAPLVCSTYSCTGTPDHGTCNGVCRVDVASLGQACKTTASGNQGNCATNLTCNTDLDDNCSSSGGCFGVCFPTNYTCRQDLDSRSGLVQYSCPISYSCTEAQGKVPTKVCVIGSKGGCGSYTYSCPNCVFKCMPTRDTEIHCSCDNPPGKNTGSGVNGFTCGNNIKTAHAYCSSSDLGCYDDPAAALTGSGDFFPGEQLWGIKCMRQPPPAAAEPPCNGPLDADGKCTSVKTSLGDFSTEPGAFVLRIFAILLASSGAIALLLIMRAGYRIMTSRGNPEGIKEGREQITAAIVGLLFLIFSIVLLQVIAGDLLKIPGFSAGGGAGGGAVGQGATAGQGCDMAGNDQCGGSGSGLICVSNGSARSGICMQETNQSCDVAGNAPQCPTGQTCTPNGAGRAGTCK